MPPTTVDSIFDLLERSNLLTDAQIASLRSEVARFQGTLQPSQIIGRLVAQELITRWQGASLLAGHDAFFLGRYKLLDELGTGGMGNVFKAKQTGGLGRVVAIKLLSKELVRDPDATARFYREIQAAAALNHANIVTAYDADCVGDTHFLVMEYVDGRDLSRVGKEVGQMPIAQACEYIRQTALGLEHAHQQGMVHRDIKPSNLLLTQGQHGKPVIKILDMGLARFSSETAEDGGLTKTGQIMGTADYIAPEQAQKTKEADIRSDIYSLGCTLFRLLTGRLPFEGDNAIEKLMARAMHDAPAVQSVRADVPDGLNDVVAKMMARDPEGRYAIPGEVVDALAPFAQAEEAEPAPAEELSQVVKRDSDLQRQVGQTITRLEGSLTNHADLAPAQEEFPAQSTDDLLRPRPGSGITLPEQPPRHAGEIPVNIRRRKETDRRLWIAVTGGVVLLAAVLGGYFTWVGASETTIVVEWPEEERLGGTLTVDGRKFTVPKKGPLRFEGQPGKRSIRLQRAGYATVSKTWKIPRGETRTLKPKWIPKESTARREGLKQLQSRFYSALIAWDGKRPPVDDPKLTDLRQRYVAFCRKWRGTAEGIAAQEDMKRLLWPVDRLRRSDVVAHFSRNSEDVEEFPEELVGLFGDGRLHAWGRAVTLAFNEDGSRLISAGGYHITYWDSGKGFRKRSLPRDTYGRIVAGPDGSNLLATSGRNGSIVLRDLTTGEILRTIDAHRDECTSVAFHPDGRSIVSTGIDGVVRLWDVASGDPGQTLHDDDDRRFLTAAFHPGGELLAVGGLTAMVELWKKQGDEWSLDREIPLPDPGAGRVWFVEQGQSLLVADRHRRAHLFDLDSDGQRFSAPRDFTALAVARDGEAVAMGSKSGNVELFKTAGGQWLRNGLFGVQKGQISALAFSPDGTRLASGADNGTIVIWDTQRGTALLKPQPFTALDVDPTGHTVAVGLNGSTVEVRDIATTDVVRTFEDFGQQPVVDVQFTASGTRLVSITPDHVPRFWDVKEDRAFNVGLITPSKTLVLNPVRDQMALAAGKKVSLRSLDDVLDDKVLGEHQGYVQSVAFSQNGRLCAATAGPHVRIWNVAERKLYKSFQAKVKEVSRLAFSPDGKYLAGCEKHDGGDGAKLWDAARGTELQHFQRGASAVCFSPDGEHLVVARSEGKLTFHTYPDGVMQREIAVGPPEGAIERVVYTPDGRHLVTLNSNGTVYVLRLEEWSYPLDFKP